MNIEFAKNVVRKYGNLFSTNYAWRKFCLDHCKFVSAEPAYYCLEEETTYDKCIDVTISVDFGDVLICKLTMYNGDMLYGNPTDIRAVFFYKIDEYCQLLDALVDKKLMEIVHNEIKKEDESAFRLRVKEKFKVIFDGVMP